MQEIGEKSNIQDKEEKESRNLTFFYQKPEHQENENSTYLILFPSAWNASGLEPNFINFIFLCAKHTQRTAYTENSSHRKPLQLYRSAFKGTVKIKHSIPQTERNKTLQKNFFSGLWENSLLKLDNQKTKSTKLCSLFSPLYNHKKTRTQAFRRKAQKNPKQRENNHQEIIFIFTRCSVFQTFPPHHSSAPRLLSSWPPAAEQERFQFSSPLAFAFFFLTIVLVQSRIHDIDDIS